MTDFRVVVPLRDLQEAVTALNESGFFVTDAKKVMKSVKVYDGAMKIWNRVECWELEIEK